MLAPLFLGAALASHTAALQPPPNNTTEDSPAAIPAGNNARAKLAKGWHHQLREGFTNGHQDDIDGALAFYQRKAQLDPELQACAILVFSFRQATTDGNLLANLQPTYFGTAVVSAKDEPTPQAYSVRTMRSLPASMGDMDRMLFNNLESGLIAEPRTRMTMKMFPTFPSLCPKPEKVSYDLFKR